MTSKREWRKRARRCKAMKGYESRWADVLTSKCGEVRRERDAALNKVEELRQDNIRLATELARVQGVSDALLAWQRRVREAWDAYDAEDEVEASTLDRLPRAIEVEAGTKEEP